ncbi:MAG TPA: DUF4214 domain-containing protein [Gemmataceae bacterium]|nr:DUF4214 domain-containing protein [Gemmataceae bacterium]
MLTVEALESRDLLSGNGLDPTFGSGGEVFTSFGGLDGAAKVLVQPNGKIVAVGTLTSGSGESFALVRYNSDGSLDTTFGTNGEVTGPVGSATGAALDANGDIIVVGQDPTTTHFLVARFTSAGAPDDTFGTAGVVTTAVVNATHASVAVQPADGKIVVAGDNSYDSPPTSVSTIDVIRYNTNGTLDTTFGTGGVANAGNGTVTNQVLIQTDGKIVVAGNERPSTASGNAAFFIKRLNSNGSVDNTVQPFVDIGVGSDIAIALALQSDGKFLELGTANGEPILVRLNSDGSLDTSFGVRGQVFMDSTFNFGSNSEGSETPTGLAIQSNGQIIVIGASGPASSHVLIFTLVVTRFNADGSLDTRFGNGGMVSTSGGSVPASDVVVQPLDGKIIVAGGGDGFVLDRFLGGPSESLTGTPNQQFVEQAYLDMLGRVADTNGLAAWSSLLDQGQATRAQVALAIEASSESHGLVIEALFVQILHRTVDPPTEEGLTNFLNSGGTAQQVALALLNSPEYLNDNGNTASGFVTGLYRDLLHRSPDTGDQYWLQAIDNGSSMAAVAAAFLGSAESDQDVIDGFFHRFLNRAGDSAGITYYVSLLQQGASWEEIEASIIGSAEYFARAQA